MHSHRRSEAIELICAQGMTPEDAATLYYGSVGAPAFVALIGAASLVLYAVFSDQPCSKPLDTTLLLQARAPRAPRRPERGAVDQAALAAHAPPLVRRRASSASPSPSSV